MQTYIATVVADYFIGKRQQTVREHKKILLMHFADGREFFHPREHKNMSKHTQHNHRNNYAALHDDAKF